MRMTAMEQMPTNQLKAVLEAYRDLLRSIDEMTMAIGQLYAGEVQCEPGCSSCCPGGISLFPVEAFNIQSLQPRAVMAAAGDDESCIFLKNGICGIYEHRPVLCRTQGYPLLYGREDETGSYEISVCELNFRNTNLSIAASMGRVIHMDEINYRLAALNILFHRETGMEDRKGSLRVPMEDIMTCRLWEKG